MSVSTLARVAVPLMLGIALGAKLREQTDEAEPTTNTHTFTERDVATKLRKKGMHLLTDDNTPQDNADLGSYLARQYLGLYCLGRTNGRLMNEARNRVAGKLCHLHTMHKPRRDRNLIAWYETVGVSNDNSLAQLLSECPLTNRFDTRYIAYAMGEDVPKLSFDGLLKEATDHFRDLT